MMLPKLEALRFEVNHQVQYSSHKQYREEYTESIKIIENMINDMRKRYKTNTSTSIQYCKAKTNSMLIGVNMIIDEMGKL